MTFSRIAHVAHSLPKKIVTNHDLAGILDTSDEWIYSRTGIKERCVAQDETAVTLAQDVAEQLVMKSGCQVDEIDFVIVASISQDATMPSLAAKVQSAIGANKAFAFDISAACSGFVFALATADKLIASGAYQKGIVIGSETMSRTLDWQDRSTAVLFGDGAGGVLLEASETRHFLAENLYTDGRRGDSLQLPKAFSATPFSDKERISSYLTMEGRAVFDFVVKEVPKSIQETLADVGLSAAKVDYYLLHQANYRLLDKISKKIGVDIEKLPANIARYGNTSAASIPILLSECLADGRLMLGSGQVVLFSGFGGGLTWGNILVKL